MRPGSHQAGKCRELWCSVVVVWCRLVVWRSGAQLDVSLLGTSQPGYVGGPPLEGHEPTDTTERGDTKAMIELIENIAKAIVDKPDQVRVNGVEGENSIVIELRVAKEDIGKVIGKNGRTITAMRTILNATRAQKEKRHVLEVLE